MRNPWLSWLLLTVVYLTYSYFLRTAEISHVNSVWIGSAAFAIAQAAIVTIFWKPSRNFLLLGFQSDAGSFVMVLLLASLAVIAVVQFRLFSYFLIMVSATLLARVDTLLATLNNQIAFLVLSFFPLLGLALGWLLFLLMPMGAPGQTEPTAFLHLSG